MNVGRMKVLVPCWDCKGTRKCRNPVSHVMADCLGCGATGERGIELPAPVVADIVSRVIDRRWVAISHHGLTPDDLRAILSAAPLTPTTGGDR